MNKPEPLSSQKGSARWRQRMREQGYRQKTFWVLDLRRPEVREQIRREAKAIAQADRESDDMAFIDAVSMWDDLPPYDAPVSDDED